MWWFISIWVLGIIGNFYMSYYVTKIEQKKNHSKKYTWNDVFETQYQNGGPLVLIPFMGAITTIVMIGGVIFHNKNIEPSNWFNKEI